MMIPIHRQKVLHNLFVEMPDELYKTCYKIANNQKLLSPFSLFSEARNKARSKVRLENWEILSKNIRSMYDLPTNSRIFLRTRTLNHGICSFYFFTKDKDNGII